MASPYGGMKVHPLADAFPLLEGEAFEELKNRIGKNGLLNPIVTHEGQILDGRNRKRACQELGIACAERPYTGDDPAGFVWDENVARRHLTPSQIAWAAQEMETLGWGQRKDFTVRKDLPEPGAESSAEHSAPEPAASRRDIARKTGASYSHMGRAKVVREKAVPEVGEAVKQGKLGLATAERIAKQTPERQKEIIALSPEEIAKAVPAPKTRPKLAAVPDPEFREPEVSTAAVPQGKGVMRPETRMRRHMALPEITFLRGVYKDWKDQEQLITSLDRDELYAFADSLRKTKADLVRLIHLIEKHVSEENEESK